MPWVIGSCMTKAPGGEGGFFYFVTAAELACFHNFCRHFLTNPVRNLLVSARSSPEWHSVSQAE